MTMKKIGLSVVTASIILATSAIAGTLSPNGIPTVSSELMETQSVDLNLTSAIGYKCTMNNTEVSAASEAGIELTIPGLKDAKGLRLIKNEDNTTVATLDNIVNNKLIFKGHSGASIVEGVNYTVVSIDSNDSIDNNATSYLELNTVKGASGATATLNTTSNDGVSVLDRASGKILDAKPQFSLKVNTKADQLIDASDGFFEFTAAAPTQLQDIVVIQFDSLGTNALDYPAKQVALSAVLNFDQNLTGYKITPTTSPSTNTDIVQTANQNFDSNVTYSLAATDANISKVATTTFTKTNSDAEAMDVTNFNLSGSVTFTGTTTPYSIASKLDAGSWQIFGYNVRIPNVVANENKTTYANFSNMSNIPASVIFTFFPQVADLDGAATTGAETGESCVVTSASQLPANTSVKYNLNKLLANSDCAVKTGNFALKVSIPTNPAQVVGNAYVKNTVINQFITLPVYGDNNHLSY